MILANVLGRRRLILSPLRYASPRYPLRASSVVCSFVQPPPATHLTCDAGSVFSPSQPTLHALRPNTMRNAALHVAFRSSTTFLTARHIKAAYSSSRPTHRHTSDAAVLCYATRCHAACEKQARRRAIAPLRRCSAYGLTLTQLPCRASSAQALRKHGTATAPIDAPLHSASSGRLRRADRLRRTARLASSQGPVHSAGCAPIGALRPATQSRQISQKCADTICPRHSRESRSSTSSAIPSRACRRTKTEMIRLLNLKS